MYNVWYKIPQIYKLLFFRCKASVYIQDLTPRSSSTADWVPEFRKAATGRWIRKIFLPVDLQQQSWIRTHFLKLFKTAWELCASLLSPIIRSTGDNVGRLELISGGLCQPSRSELFQRLTKCQSGEVSLPVRALPYRDIIVYQRHARAG